MQKVKLIGFGLIAMFFIGYSCKKEPVDSKIFVERYLVGRWYVNSLVTLEITNKDTTQKDTLYKVIAADTSRRWVNYTEDRQFFNGKDTVAFSVDNDGKNITFATTPDSTWNLPYVRTGYFKAVFTRTQTVGNDVKRYVIEKEFRKSN